MNAHQIVEAVLFSSDAPLTADEIARADETLDEDQVEDALQYLRAEYDDAERSFQLVELAEGYQVLTRPEFAPYLERFDNVPKSSRLSGPALEALAIIAYRQPIGRVEVEYIRGVGSSGVIGTLQDRRMIEVVGRAEGLGRPLLYGTTSHFLEHFGFTSLEDLPRPEDLPVVLRDRISLGAEDDEDAGGGDSADGSNGAADAPVAAEDDADTAAGDGAAVDAGGEVVEGEDDADADDGVVAEADVTEAEDDAVAEADGEHTDTADAGGAGGRDEAEAPSAEPVDRVP